MSYTTFKGGLGYEGKVTLTLKSNNRVLKSKTYKNKGMAPLFEFLGYCLADSYEDRKGLVPSKIMLLYNHDAEDGKRPDEANPKNVTPRTLPHERIQIPVPIVNAEETKVVYNFEVSKAAIGDNGNDNGYKFNQIALYGAAITAEESEEFSAYYYLTDEFGGFETLNAADWSATTVLLIDWELTLSNKNIETQNNREEEVS